VKVAFTSHGWEDYCRWSADRKTMQKTNRMVEESWRDAGQGIGKPERLSGDLAGLWSRRITDKHRLVYEVVDGTVVVHQVRYHY